MITANVIQRIFLIRYEGDIGTCFTIELDGKQYFVTAKHVLQSKSEEGEIINQFDTGDSLDIYQHNNWVPVEAVLVGHSETTDVSVFSLTTVYDSPPMPATSNGLVYGQDVYFLGFPYGFMMEDIALRDGFPLPLVKKGIVSTLMVADTDIPFYIDGHSNPGFSGAPVVFKNHKTKEFQVAGILSSRHYERDGSGECIENSNSGIIVVYPINNAIDLIELSKK